MQDLRDVLFNLLAGAIIASLKSRPSRYRKVHGGPVRGCGGVDSNIPSKHTCQGVALPICWSAEKGTGHNRGTVQEMP